MCLENVLEMIVCNEKCDVEHVCNVVDYCYISANWDTCWMFKECYLTWFLYSVCWSQEYIVYKVFTNNRTCKRLMDLGSFLLLLVPRCNMITLHQAFAALTWCQDKVKQWYVILTSYCLLMKHYHSFTWINMFLYLHIFCFGFFFAMFGLNVKPYSNLWHCISICDFFLSHTADLFAVILFHNISRDVWLWDAHSVNPQKH